MHISIQEVKRLKFLVFVTLSEKCPQASPRKPPT